jgi:hypothetical protein
MCSPGEEFFNTRERAAADEQNVARIDLDCLLIGVFSSALRRNRSNRTLEQL